jgi:uncharacterized membrane protein YcaP (DUF421 family)
MEFVLRAVCVYAFLLALFTIAGKRSLAEVDTFDLVLLLIISEATQQALIGEDYSLTTAAIVLSTLVGLEILMGKINRRWPAFEKSMRGGPLVLVEHGKVLAERLRAEQLTEEEILTAARQRHGLTSFEEIRYAILETSGEISIVPA